MLFVWRSCRKSVGLSAKTLYSQATVTQPAVDRIPYLDSPPPFHVNNSPRNPWTYQAVLEDVTAPETKKLSSITTEHSTQDTRVQGIQENYSVNRPYRVDCGQDVMTGQDVHSTVLEGINSHVSLYGCMQSNVPQPHNPDSCNNHSCMGYSSFHNMPGYSNQLQDKYIAGSLHHCHPSRQFSTSSICSENRKLPYNCNNDAYRICEQLLCSEQDQLIHKIVKDYQQRRAYNTSGKSEVRSSGSSTDLPSQDGNTSALSSTPSSDSENNMSQKDKLKRAIKEYGGTVGVFYFGLSAFSLCSCYIAVSSGLDVQAFFTKLGVGEKILESLSTSYGDFTTLIVAYAVHKVFLPLRIGLTLTFAPFIVRRLRKLGFIKPPTKSGHTGKAK